MKIKISAVIHTYNASKYLREVIECVKDLDEVLICDMESTDNTLEIAKEYGCTIKTFPKGNYTIPEPARDFAIHSVRNQWVLVVDADEFVTPELKEWIDNELSKPDHKDGYYIPRKNIFLGEFVKSGYPDYQLRLFDQTKATWPPVVHSFPKIKGTTAYLPKDYELAFVHMGDSMKSRIKKMDIYSDNDLVKRKKTHVSLLGLMLRPAFVFFRSYILRGGFIYGRLGFVTSYNDAIFKFFYLAKVFEREKNSKIV